MKSILLKTAASAAFVFGIIPVITGTRALMAVFDPGYSTFKLLIIYNILTGLASVMAGYLIWKLHKAAIKISLLITIAHISVFLSLLTIFNEIIAQQSVNAMTVRIVAWIIIFGVVFTLNRSQKSDT
jgi:hypothetical protein